MAKKAILSTAGLILVILFFASILSFLDRKLLDILIRPVQADTGINDAQFGLLQGAAFAFTYAVASFPVAYLADRFSSKWVIIWSVVVWSAMTLVFGLASSFAVLVIARIGLALGEAGLSPAAISLVRQTFTPERQPSAVALLTTSVYVGGGLAMMVGGPTLAALQAHQGPLPFDLEPWRLMFAFCGVLGALVVGLLLFMPDIRPEQTVRSSAKLPDFIRALQAQSGPVFTYVMALTGLCAMLYAIMAWTPAMFLRTFGWSEQETGLAYGAVFTIGGIIGALGTGRLTGFLKQHDVDNANVVVIRYATLLLGSATIMAVSSPNGTMALAFTGLAMVGVGSLLALGAFGLQALLPKEFSARAVSMYFLLPGTVGGSFGPSAIPLIQDALGERGSTGLSIGIFTAAMTVWAAFWLTMFLRLPRYRKTSARAHELAS